MNVVLELYRQDPASGGEGEFKRYELALEPTDRILDGLIRISRDMDGSLSFRKSCAHGVCGSDAMRINGKERLACKTLVQDVAENEGDVVRIEPLRHMTVQRDLMVDQQVFFEKFRSVKPFLIPQDEVQEKERIQSPEERALFDEATKCINCSACYSACPVLDDNPDFIGPAAIVAAARYVFDSRDQGLEARLDVLDSKNGVWPCENHFECTRVCPRDIKITKLINLTKREIKKYREARGEKTAEE